MSVIQQRYHELSFDQRQEFLHSIKEDGIHGTLAAFTEGLDLLAKHLEGGKNSKNFIGGGSVLGYVYVTVSLDSLPPESEEGRALIALGFYPGEHNNWTWP